MADFVKVAKTNEIEPGQARLVDVKGKQIALFNIDGAYYAIEDVCTHDGGPLAEGEVEEDVVICPRHGARFSIRTGAALSFPAVTPVETYPVRVEEGDLLIGLPE